MYLHLFRSREVYFRFYHITSTSPIIDPVIIAHPNQLSKKALNLIDSLSFIFSLFDIQVASYNNSMIKLEILEVVVVKGVTQYVRILCKTR